VETVRRRGGIPTVLALRADPHVVRAGRFSRVITSSSTRERRPRRASICSTRAPPVTGSRSRASLVDLRRTLLIASLPRPFATPVPRVQLRRDAPSAAASSGSRRMGARDRGSVPERGAPKRPPPAASALAPVRILLLAHAPAVHSAPLAQGFSARGHEVRLLSAHDPRSRPGVPTRIVGWPLPISALRYASAPGGGPPGDPLLPSRGDRGALPSDYGFLAAVAGPPLDLVCWGLDLLVNATRTPLHRARPAGPLRRAQSIHVDAENLRKRRSGWGPSAPDLDARMGG